ncbi:hypothetical protein [Marimonas lutisalis]|uniref:hypothetical protein n=1 Tax=Marimonas lutisalis TaxID=2545756 RepID=UPI0010F60EEE|nr:hypothetical protein [Marimonas lutisalis]
MQVMFHAGVHCTDDDRVLKCLLKNRGDFSDIGSLVPPPGRYRKLLHQTLVALSNAEPAPDARDILLDTILDGEQADRLLLSNENLFCIAKLAINNGVFYPNAAVRVGQLKSLFRGDQIELFLAIRNPATFLPALYEKAPVEDFIELTRGTDPRQLRWSELVWRIRTDHPDVPLTIWCNEDSPLIWAQIIREMAGLNPGTKIKGGFDLLAEIMTRDGMKRFRDYLAKHPVMTEIQKRRVMVAFLDKFAREDMIEEELDLPGWTEELVDELTEAYDEDMFEISRIPGVTFIAP